MTAGRFRSRCRFSNTAWRWLMTAGRFSNTAFLPPLPLAAIAKDADFNEKLLEPKELQMTTRMKVADIVRYHTSQSPHYRSTPTMDPKG